MTHDIKDPLHIVRIESIRYFDDCQYSYLPYFDEIFGVYTSQKDAQRAVWSYFGKDDEYEYICDGNIKDKEAPYADEIFKYVDKHHGGYAYYAIYYHTEWIFKNEKE